jgi:acyl CoA:acetate/3-ketoacid CoA transferase beta subunit
VITDIGVLVPDPETLELIMIKLHPGVTVQQAQAATGWKLKLAPYLGVTAPPTEHELANLRRLEESK